MAELEIGAIQERLFNLLKEWTYCDLILDRELSDPFYTILGDLADKQLAFAVNPPKAAVHIDQCLMLARLSTAHLEELEASAAIALEQNTNSALPVRAIGGWLLSRQTSPERMAHWLEKAIIVRVQNASPALLRLWDPRVFGHVLRILTPEQLAALFGPIDGWVWIDRSGQLQLVFKPVLPDGALVPRSVCLTSEQDAAIDRIELINTLLKALSGLGHGIDVKRDAELDRLIQLAHKKGHVDTADTIAYCLHVLLIDRDFDTIPRVCDTIMAMRERGLGLCTALEQFDDTFWSSCKATTEPG